MAAYEDAESPARGAGGEDPRARRGNWPGLGQNNIIYSIGYRKQGALGLACLAPEDTDHKGLGRGQVVADFALDTEVYAVTLNGIPKKDFGHGTSREGVELASVAAHPFLDRAQNLGREFSVDTAEAFENLLALADDNP